MQDNLFKEKLKKIRLFVTDFDGIHTDGKVCVDQDGRESVICSRKDGLAYNMLAKAGIYACVISKEANQVVLARCKKLNIDCHQKVHDGQGKLEILQSIMKDKGFSVEEVLYMGDDINDKEVLEFVGLSVTVNDGHESLKKLVDYVTVRDGGDHAIREVVEMVLDAKSLRLDF